MSSMKPAQLLVGAALAVLLLSGAAAQAATCDATQLTPCAGAIIGNSPPSSACCSRLKEQQPCLCTYARDPNLQRYVSSPNGKKAMASCRVPVPSC
jgi:hypothetical protein